MVRYKIHFRDIGILGSIFNIFFQISNLRFEFHARKTIFQLFLLKKYNSENIIICVIFDWKINRFLKVCYLFLYVFTFITSGNYCNGHFYQIFQPEIVHFFFAFGSHFSLYVERTTMTFRNAEDIFHCHLKTLSITTQKKTARKSNPS